MFKERALLWAFGLFIIIILYAYVVCRANTRDFYLFLSSASRSISSMDFPNFFAFQYSLSLVSLSVALSLLIMLPWFKNLLTSSIHSFPSCIGCALFESCIVFVFFLLMVKPTCLHVQFVGLLVNHNCIAQRVKTFIFFSIIRLTNSSDVVHKPCCDVIKLCSHYLTKTGQ